MFKCFVKLFYKSASRIAQTDSAPDRLGKNMYFVYFNIWREFSLSEINSDVTLFIRLPTSAKIQSCLLSLKNLSITMVVHVPTFLIISRQCSSTKSVWNVNYLKRSLCVNSVQSNVLRDDVLQCRHSRNIPSKKTPIRNGKRMFLQVPCLSKVHSAL